MKSVLLLKAALLLCAPLILLSCSSWEEVAAPNEFKPLKIISVLPTTNVYAGDSIIITGENFIDNKEYNQVWFGGNVRGVVDSATSTKLFLRVPQGAQTGLMSVSNGVYSDTLKNAISIVSVSSYNKITLNYGTFRGLTEFTRSGNDENGNFSSKYTDTVYLNGYYQHYSSKGITREIINTYLGESCLNKIKPLSDDEFRRLPFISYAERYSNVLDTLLTVEANIDLNSSIIPNLTINRYLQRHSFNGSEAVCRITTIVLKDVPYLQNNEKISIKLKGSDIKKYIQVFTDWKMDFKVTEVPNPPHHILTNISNTKGISEILSNAYFELTLE